MASGNVYLLSALMTPFGLLAPTMMNVFCYRQTAGANGSADLAVTWETGVLPTLILLLSQSVQYNALQVNNLDDLTDFVFHPITSGGEGQQPGDVLPYYNAFKFQYLRTSRGNHHGWKRIAGVPEAAQNGGAVNGTYVALMNNVALKFALTLTDTSGDAWAPRIFRAPKPLHVPPIARGDFPIFDVVQRGISTQNTRKK